MPRWRGDVNFMPALADVRVMPQLLEETRLALVAAWPAQARIAAMTLDPSVFKAYDVRGIVPDELDADGVYRIVPRLRRRVRAAQRWRSAATCG